MLSASKDDEFNRVLEEFKSSLNRDKSLPKGIGKFKI
jgi:hypothetical protein